MDYLRIYEEIITRAKERTELSGYKEKHHIFPRSFGGTNESSNIVLLSGREHFIVHRILAKVFPDTSIVHAPYKMACIGRKDCMKYGKVTARVYEFLRKEHARRISEDTEANMKKGRPGRKQTDEHKLNRVKSRKQNGGAWHTKKTRINISAALLGKPSGDRKGKKLVTEKQIEGHKKSVATRKKNGGYIRSPESIEASAAKQRGKKKNVTFSDERILQLKEEKSKKVICPHCGKEGSVIVMPRWHFNNCKQNLT